MENINKIFEEQKEKVASSLSSIYSKEDLIFIIESLRQQTIVAQESTSGYNKEYILNQVEDLIDNFDFEMHVSCEPELCGEYGGRYSLEMNTEVDVDSFKRDFISELEDYFTPVNQELK